MFCIKHERTAFLLYFTLIVTMFNFILFSSGCASTNDTSYIINDKDDASMWLNPLKSYALFNDIFVEEIPFSIIPNKNKDEYIKLLGETQYAQIGKDDYYQLTKKNLMKKHALAIRAVYPHLGGKFTLYKSKDNDYYVSYLVLGSRVYEYNKTVLIIEANELPGEIYNNFTVAR